MIKRSTKLFIEIIGGVSAGAIVLFALLAMRLYVSPIPLNFLNGAIAQILSNNQSDISMAVEQTELMWDDEHHAVVLRAESLRAFDRNNQLVATFPDLSVGLSLRALFYGQLAPSTITVYRPSLTVIRDAAGLFSFAPKPPSESAAPDAASAEPVVGTDVLVRDLLGALSDPSGGSGKLGFLRRFKIDNADVIYDDRKNGVTFWAPMVDLELNRGSGGIFGHAQLKIELNEKVTEIRADLSWPKNSDDMTVISNFDNIDFTSMVELVPELHDLAFLRLPIGGQLRLTGNPAQGVTSVRVTANGGKGMIVRPDLWPDPMSIDKLELDVQYDPSGNIQLHKFSAASGDMTAIISGQVLNQSGEYAISGDAQITQLSVKDLGKYWPQNAAVNARDWVVPNIQDGLVTEASAKIAARAKNADLSDLAVEKIDGSIRVTGATVDYFNPLPKATGVDGNATFNADQLTIHTNGGAVNGLVLGKGDIVIDGLSASDQAISIKMETAGKLTKALEIADHKPLELPSRRDIKPSNVRGDFAADLSFRFPLVKELKLEQLDIAINGDMKNAYMNNALWGFPLSRGDMKIKLTQSDMEVSGDAYVAGLPAAVMWQEDFRSTPKNSRSRYVVHADFPSIGVDILDLPKPLPWDGMADVNLDYSIDDKSMRRLSIKSDLQNASIAIPEINFWKEPGAPMAGVVEMVLNGDQLQRISNLGLKSKDVVISGDADFEPGNILSRLNLPTVNTGNNDMRLSMQKTKDKNYAVTIAGKSFDAAHLNHKRKDTKPADTNYAVDVRVGELSLGGLSALQNADARLVLRGGDFESLRASAKVRDSAGQNTASPLDITITPTPAGRKLSIKSDDAGAALRALDVYDTMLGGQLAVDGDYDDGKKSKPLAGTIAIYNFRLKQAPILAQMLNLSSLSGIVDNLSGQGIGFDKMMTNFELTDGILKIKDARISGSSIGLKSSGTVDLNNLYYDLDGILIPANGINKILSNIPLIGTILTAGGEQPLLAFNYRIKGPLAAPQVMVNPLSALTPGILREVFDNKSE